MLTSGGDAEDQRVALAAAAAQRGGAERRRRAGAARAPGVSASRAPDMPIGWPSAIAPPLTLTLSAVDARAARVECDADRGEGLVDLDQVEVGRRDCPARRSALLIALAGCDCSDASGPATMPW